ncbi:unnamed protein product [Prorocentrum cordatum]|uniref:Uncharacterized protein n=1 Tax=Prorocentrum cordatum TaxID=2364126 RepID=A0ABN9VPB1_9DINO|nr:unnamed protein product [Polarella glacialis]
MPDRTLHRMPAAAAGEAGAAERGHPLGARVRARGRGGRDRQAPVPPRRAPRGAGGSEEEQALDSAALRGPPPRARAGEGRADRAGGRPPPCERARSPRAARGGAGARLPSEARGSFCSPAAPTSPWSSAGRAPQAGATPPRRRGCC